jgi:hypothetical protein
VEKGKTPVGEGNDVDFDKGRPGSQAFLQSGQRPGRVIMAAVGSVVDQGKVIF